MAFAVGVLHVLRGSLIYPVCMCKTRAIMSAGVCLHTRSSSFRLGCWLSLTCSDSDSACLWHRRLVGISGPRDRVVVQPAERHKPFSVSPKACRGFFARGFGQSLGKGFNV